MARGIETALGYPLPHGSAARVALVRAFRRLWMAEFLNGRIPANANDQQLADLDMELAERVGAAARAPLRELRLGPSLAWEDYEDYILSVAALVARTIRAANLSPPPSEGEEDSQE